MQRRRRRMTGLLRSSRSHTDEIWYNQTWETLDDLRGGGCYDGYWRTTNYNATSDHVGCKSLARKRRMHLCGKLPFSQLADRLARYDRGFLNYDKCTAQELFTFITSRHIRIISTKTKPRKDELIQTLHDADDRQVFSKLYDMSAEIRLLIYDFYLAHFAQEPLLMPTNPPLARVSRALRAEVLPRFYSECNFRIDLTAANSRSPLGIETAFFFSNLQSCHMKRIKRVLIFIHARDDAEYLQEGQLAQIQLSSDCSRHEVTILPWRGGLSLGAQAIVSRALGAVMDTVTTRGESKGQLSIDDIYRLSWAMQRVWNHAELQDFVDDN